MTRQNAADFHEGLWFWVRGWGFLLRNRSLLKYAAFPFLLCCLWAGSIAYVVIDQLPSGMEKLGDQLGWMPGWLYYPLMVAVVMLILVGNVYIAYLFISIVSIPFNTILADRTLGILGKKIANHKSWKDWLLHNLRMLKVGLLKSLLFILLGVVIFVLSYIPGLNIFTLGCLMLLLAFDCMDYSLEPFGLGLGQRFKYCTRNWAQWFGMAAGLALTLLVPGLTLLIIPGAVVGAAIIVKSEML